jgi:hypothetical protein
MTTRKSLFEAMQSLTDHQSNAIHARYHKAIHAVGELMDELGAIKGKNAIDQQFDSVYEAYMILEAMPLGMIPQTEKGDK